MKTHTHYRDSYGVLHIVRIVAEFTDRDQRFRTIHVPFMRGNYGTISDEYLTIPL